MRFIKMLSLAAVAAVAAMALVGASSAAAEPTALCKVNETPCSAANQVKTLHMVAEDPVLKATFLFIPITILCEKSLGEATVLALGSPQVADVTALTWTNCKLGEETCTVTTSTLGKFDILRTGTNKGTATSLDNLVNVVCAGLGLNCTYGKNNPVLTVEGAGGGSNGKLVAKELKVENSAGSGCPTNSFWTATYVPLEAVFVSS